MHFIRQTFFGLSEVTRLYSYFLPVLSHSDVLDFIQRWFYLERYVEKDNLFFCYRHFCIYLMFSVFSSQAPSKKLMNTCICCTYHLLYFLLPSFTRVKDLLLKNDTPIQKLCHGEAITLERLN